MMKGSLVEGLSPEEFEAFLHGPSGPAPPGMTQNLINPQTMSTEFIILCTVCAAFTGLALAMRIYTRWALARKLIWEDAILCAGWVLFTAGVNTTIYQATSYKLGANTWNVRVFELSNQLRLFHYGTLLFCVTMLMLRVAIIMQVIRHFVPKGSRNFTFWAGYALIGANTVFWVAVTLMEVFSCTPRKKLWEFYGPGKCIDREKYMVASAVMNLASEVLIMVLPQRIIWSLSLSTKQKLELTPVFLVGILTCICSATRLWQQTVQSQADISYYLGDAVMLWTVPEIACSVLVPCLPAFPQFIRILQRKTANARPASTVFQLGLPITAGRRAQKRWGSRESKSTRMVVSDHEYHELVVQTETTVDIAEREHVGPWIQQPYTVHVTGGNGRTKVFKAPGGFGEERRY